MVTLVLALQLEASTNQELSQQIPLFNLPSKILCNVVNIQLRVRSLSCYLLLSLHIEETVGVLCLVLGPGLTISNQALK